MKNIREPLSINVWNDIVVSCASDCKYSQSINGKVICSHRNEELSIYVLNGELIDAQCLFKQPFSNSTFEDLGFNQFEDQNVYEKLTDDCLYQLVNYDSEIYYMKWTFPKLKLRQTVIFVKDNPENFKLAFKSVKL